MKKAEKLPYLAELKKGNTFPQLKLKELYSQFGGADFDIVGVSIDQGEAINDWKKIISYDKLEWRQFRDADQKNASKLSIQFYPTNFLLDKSGVIVERNISMDRLQKMLRKE